MRKRGFEFSFAWLFALLVGAVILFLAIYFAFKLVETGSYQTNVMTAKQLSIIFEPLETGLASGKSNIARLNEETRIYNNCKEEGNFGKHKISTSSKTFKRWSKPSGEISVPNKYIFSNGTEEGRIVYFFSKPFKMPWKVSEIIFLTTREYCFVNAPEFVIDEVKGLNLQNIRIENCTGKETKVCFDYGDCEILVKGNCLDYECENEYEYGYVIKNKESMFYTGSLIYGAIFSNKEIYECNIKRLMKRLVQEALIYNDEANFLSGKCGTALGIMQIVNAAKSLRKPDDLLYIKSTAKEVELQSNAAQCQLW